MSHWQDLYAGHAFKPHPSLWELADAHVPFEQLGVENSPERQVLTHVSEGDGVILLTGAPGRGKSSTLAYVARHAGKHPESDREYLALFVPVAARPLDSVDGLGREVIFEFLSAVAETLPKRDKERLERKLAEQVSRQRTPAGFNAKLVGGLPGLRGEVGVTLARETTTIVGERQLDNYGGLRTLGMIARSHGHELVIVLEDTDAWSVRSDGPAVAETFFTRVLRPLVSEADVSVVVAVQDRWTSEPYFEDVAERAIARLPMPAISSQEQARTAVELVCRRRIERVPEAQTSTDPLGELFTSEALDMLATKLAENGSFRDPLELLRDTLDHFSDALPERIDREHLIEGGG